MYGPTFMVYELRLLWHTNPDFYAMRAVFIGVGGGLQYIDSPSSICERQDVYSYHSQLSGSSEIGTPIAR